MNDMAKKARKPEKIENLWPDIDVVKWLDNNVKLIAIFGKPEEKLLEQAERIDRETAMAIMVKNIDAMDALAKAGKHDGLFYCEGYNEIVASIRNFKWEIYPQTFKRARCAFIWLFNEIMRGKRMAKSHTYIESIHNMRTNQFEVLRKLCTLFIEELKNVPNEIEMENAFLERCRNAYQGMDI